MFITLIEAGVVGTILTAILIPLVKWGYAQRKKDKTKEYFKRRGEIQLVINTLRENTKSLRVFIIQAKNGGGVPTPDKPIYTSILYESVRPGTPRVKDTWQNEPADEAVSTVLNQMIAQQTILYEVDDLLDSPLKDASIALNLKQITWHLIGMTGTKLLYITLTWDCLKNPPHDATISNELRVAARALLPLLTDK